MTHSVKQLLQGLVERLPDDCDWPQVHYHLYVAKKLDRGLREAESGEGYTTEEVRDMIKQWRREWEEHPEKRYPRIASREQLIDYLFHLGDRIIDADPAERVNVSTDRFLEALRGWLDSCDGYYRNVGRPMDVDQASWQLFADALDAAIVYE